VKCFTAQLTTRFVVIIIMIIIIIVIIVMIIIIIVMIIMIMIMIMIMIILYLFVYLFIYLFSSQYCYLMPRKHDRLTQTHAILAVFFDPRTCIFKFDPGIMKEPHHHFSE